MKVTAQTKRETRTKILNAAESLLRLKGYEQTTTRQIAERAQIGLATLFNYFPTKEAIVSHLASTALKAAREKFAKIPGKRMSLEEDLFTLIACELRCLKPYRTFLTHLVETTLSPMGSTRDPSETDGLRTNHLEAVRQLIESRGFCDSGPPIALHLYWTVYTGVLAYWVTDESPKQEDTLAVLDESLAMFAGWLNESARQTK